MNIENKVIEFVLEGAREKKCNCKRREKKLGWWKI